MNVVRSAALVALAGVGLMTGSAVAEAQASCQINESSPFQLNSAKIYLGKAATGKEDEKRKHLQNAVKVLTERADRINNQLGRQWLLGRTLMEWSRQPGVQPVLRRGDLGYVDNVDQQVNIIFAADSAFAAVEALNAECGTLTRPYRQNIFAQFYKRAADAFNAGQLDSASAAADLAKQLRPRSVEIANVEALIALQRNDAPAAMAAFQRVIDYAGSDTAYRSAKNTALNNVGIFLSNAADTASNEATKKALYERARDTFRQYLAENPGDVNAQSGLARALTALGDKQAVAQIYGEMVNNPSKFTDIQLFEAGANAAISKDNETAIKLFEAGLAMNPHFRDALFNLANVYFLMENADKLAEVTQRLVAVDPDNPDNWRLMAGVYQIRQKTEANAARKKALTDTLIKAIEKFQKMPVQVTFDSFQHQGARHTLSGQVRNLGTAARDYALKFEFLDKTGQVIATQTANVGSVAPQEAKEFRVTVTQSGVVAYRYASVQ